MRQITCIVINRMQSFTLMYVEKFSKGSQTIPSVRVAQTLDPSTAMLTKYR